MVFPWAAVITDPPRMLVRGKEEVVGMNEEAVEVVAEAVDVVEATEQLPLR